MKGESRARPRVKEFLRLLAFPCFPPSFIWRQEQGQQVARS